ncbi:nucleotidyltransferase domain-containing protein [Bacillus benzoevorans]|uniref:Nucleotidyltransferase n=1 Tax=Bacillus benzoevorans TaxID=1456 RepID=A0A7X0HS19_9BACI|nr:nucleotidyltransferase domain-containing protein [Bacillus benzoevorans]MBB6444635.1 hypothetical protein [Bacillus benzoevorans]
MEEWLKELEFIYNIDILFAAETGSRAWGGATEQSDYDVRFIFQHRDVKTYLSLQKAAETHTFQTPYDAQGWDIFKVLSLLEKSNPNLLEWSLSPIIYRDSGGFSRNLYRCIEESYSLYSLYQHYIHLSARNIKDVLGKDFTRQSQKKLIQAVRAFLLAKTIIITEAVPHSALYSHFQGIFATDETGLTTFYHELMAAKKRGMLVSAQNVKQGMEIMEKERIQLDKQCEALPRGGNIRDRLNQWIWDLLRI